MPDPLEIESVSQWNSTLRNATAQGKTVYVDFHAEWCGPCKTIAPIFTKLAKSYPQSVFLRVNVDNLQPIAQKYKVTAMPTFYAIKAGTQVDNLRGADPRGLETMISKHAGPNPPVPPLPEEAETAKTEGNKLFGQGKWQEAVEAYSRAIQHAPKSPHLRANRSLAYLKIGTDEMRPKAMQDALDATAFDERWAKGWVRLADVMVAEADNCKSKGGKLAEGYKKGLEAAQEALENALALAEEQGLNSQVTEIQKKLNEVNDKVENT